MRRREFEQLVMEALDGLPRQFRRSMRNIAVIVEAAPSQALLETMGLWPDHTLLEH
jgi:predicted Zn-dependent protease with MMP-like domain